MAIWLRIGDQGDYTKHEALSDVAEALFAAGVRSPLSYCSGYAVSAPGFERRNYISLYYGKNDSPTMYPGAEGAISVATVQHLDTLLAGMVATPEKPRLFQLLDRINECWRAIEKEVLASHPFPLDGGKLTIGRQPGSGRMRLLYCGKPLSECSVADRVDAADDLANFQGRLAAADANVSAKVRTALSTLESRLGSKTEKA